MRQNADFLKWQNDNPTLLWPSAKRSYHVKRNTCSKPSVIDATNQTSREMQATMQVLPMQ